MVAFQDPGVILEVVCPVVQREEGSQHQSAVVRDLRQVCRQVHSKASQLWETRSLHNRFKPRERNFFTLLVSLVVRQARPGKGYLRRARISFELPVAATR